MRTYALSLFLCFGGGLMLFACTSADKKACLENNDLQACNRECVGRDDKEACAKAEVIKASQKK